MEGGKKKKGVGGEVYWHRYEYVVLISKTMLRSNQKEINRHGTGLGRNILITFAFQVFLYLYVYSDKTGSSALASAHFFTVIAGICESFIQSEWDTSSFDHFVYNVPPSFTLVCR